MYQVQYQDFDSKVQISGAGRGVDTPLVETSTTRTGSNIVLIDSKGSHGLDASKVRFCRFEMLLHLSVEYMEINAE